jgi:hypothetical protein
MPEKKFGKPFETTTFNEYKHMTKDRLLLLARFSVRARRYVGHIDTRRLGDDSAYRAEICARIFSDGDEETMLMAMQLKDQFDYAKFRGQQKSPAILGGALSSHK